MFFRAEAIGSAHTEVPSKWPAGGVGFKCLMSLAIALLSARL